MTLFASGDSTAKCELVPTVPAALRPLGFNSDPTGYLAATIAQVRARQADFDVIHAHLEWANLMLMRSVTTPSVATFHGRLDHPWATDALADPPPGLVAISRSHAATHPEVPWPARLQRAQPRGRPLRAAPQRCPQLRGTDRPREGGGRRHRDRPAEWPAVADRGQAGPDRGGAGVLRDRLQAGPQAGRRRVPRRAERRRARRSPRLELRAAHARHWPEPFGLVAIEAMACGTPVVARRSGALPEIVRDGIDGFLGDDPANLAFLLERVDGLDRERIRTEVMERFSARRMVDGYLEVYHRRLAGEDLPPGDDGLLHLPSAVSGV